MASINDLIADARRHLGETESPRGSNVTWSTKTFGRIPGYPHDGYGYPWCHAYLSSVAKGAGMRKDIDYPHTASCENGVGWFKARKRWYSTPKVGRWIYYGPRGGTHVEMVIGVSATHITTIGGNTSGDGLSGRYWDGDAVATKTVARSSSRIYGYGEPVYTASSSKPSPPTKPSTPPVYPGRVLKVRSPYMSGSDVKTVQARLIRLGYAVRNGGADGVYGPGTKAAVTAFQKYVRLAADGEVGPKTWKALFG